MMEHDNGDDTRVPDYNNVIGEVPNKLSGMDVESGSAGFAEAEATFANETEKREFNDIFRLQVNKILTRPFQIDAQMNTDDKTIQESVFYRFLPPCELKVKVVFKSEKLCIQHCDDWAFRHVVWGGDLGGLFSVCC